MPKETYLTVGQAPELPTFTQDPKTLFGQVNYTTANTMIDMGVLTVEGATMILPPAVWHLINGYQQRKAGS